jgi:hypothetical protein
VSGFASCIAALDDCVQQLELIARVFFKFNFDDIMLS